MTRSTDTSLIGRIFGRRKRRVEAALKYAYCRGFAVGQVWKDDPRGEPFATAEYQWETCGRDYCMEVYENG